MGLTAMVAVVAIVGLVIGISPRGGNAVDIKSITPQENYVGQAQTAMLGMTGCQVTCSDGTSCPEEGAGRADWCRCKSSRPMAECGNYG